MSAIMLVTPGSVPAWSEAEEAAGQSINDPVGGDSGLSCTPTGPHGVCVQRLQPMLLMLLLKPPHPGHALWLDRCLLLLLTSTTELACSSNGSTCQLQHSWQLELQQQARCCWLCCRWCTTAA
jgi:hypothetical protein